MLPMLEWVLAEGDSACKWAMPAGNYTGGCVNAGRSRHCPADLIVVGAVGYGSLHELLRQQNLLPAGLQSLGATVQMMSCDAAWP